MAQGGGGLRGGVSRLALAEARSRHSAGGAGYIPGLRVETSPLAGKGKKAIGLDAGVCVCGGECGHMDHDRCYGSPSARAPASVPPTLPENREYLTVCHLSTARTHTAIPGQEPRGGRGVRGGFRSRADPAHSRAGNTATPARVRGAARGVARLSPCPRGFGDHWALEEVLLHRSPWTSEKGAG